MYELLRFHGGQLFAQSRRDQSSEHGKLTAWGLDTKEYTPPDVPLHSLVSKRIVYKVQSRVRVADQCNQHSSETTGAIVMIIIALRWKFPI